MPTIKASTALAITSALFGFGTVVAAWEQSPVTPYYFMIGIGAFFAGIVADFFEKDA